MLEYKKRFEYHLNEDMTAASAFSGGGNANGQTAGSFPNVDSYAPGDARRPKALGEIDLADRKKKPKKKDNKKTPFQRRRPPQGKPAIQSGGDSGMSGPSNNMNHGFM